MPRMRYLTEDEVREFAKGYLGYSATWSNGLKTGRTFKYVRPYPEKRVAEGLTRAFKNLAENVEVTYDSMYIRVRVTTSCRVREVVREGLLTPSAPRL